MSSNNINAQLIENTQVTPIGRAHIVWRGTPQKNVLKLDGTAGTLSAPGFRWKSGGPVTVVFTIKVNPDEVANSRLFSVGGKNAPNAFQAYVPWGDSNLYWDYGDWGGNGRISTPFTPYLGKWTDVALVSAGNSGNFRAIYINGELKASKTSSDGPDEALSGLTIGSSSDKIPKAEVNNFIIFNRVLTQTEIRELNDLI